MKSIKLLIAGEGPNELGSVKDDGTRILGAVEALLGKVRTGSWEVRRKVVWKDIHKLRANDPGRGDERSIERLALWAEEHGCHALAFVRDRDGDRKRERVIENTIQKLANEKRSSLAIIGGLPVEMLEAWLLALIGVSGAEAMEDPTAVLAEHDIRVKSTTAAVQIVMNARLSTIPEDAVSLRRWLRRAAIGLRVKNLPKRWP